MTDKLNLAASPDKSDWYRIESIDIGNGPPSDHVGVVTAWQPPDAFAGVAPGTLFAVQKEIAAGAWRESSQAEKWAGVAVAKVMDLDLNDPKNRAKCHALLKSWITGGALVVVRKQDQERKERPFIEVGQWETN